VAYLDIFKGGTPGYISGVYFQTCSNFGIIFFRLSISSNVLVSKGAQTRAPKIRPWQQTRDNS